jgi:ADP-heptose:LPS heptosyltransferase
MPLKFFCRLDHRLDGLRKKYARREITVARKLLSWAFQEFFRTLLRQPLRIICQLSTKWQGYKRQRKGDLKIAIAMPGGIGDILMYGLTVKEFSKRIGYRHTIDIYTDGESKKDTLDFVFQKFPFIRQCIGDDGRKWPMFMEHTLYRSTEPYDVLMRMDRCAIVAHCDYKHVNKRSPWLSLFCRKNRLFYEKNAKFFKNPPIYHSMVDQWSILCKKKRIQQPDQCQMLGISDSSGTFLELEPDSYGLLSTLELQDTSYITLQRGLNHCDKLCDSTKLWPIYHYEKFIELFHQKYPSIKIVQLGHSPNTCRSLSGVDINLIGKTSLSEVAVLLKHSLFHLDGEAGMVHMKKFLNGRSIVLFGPTPVEVFGYPENINITSNGCHSWCEWVSNDWSKTCLRGFKEAPCMASIAPGMVMEAADKILNERKDYVYTVKESSLAENGIVDYIRSQNKGKEIKIIDIFNRQGLTLARELRKSFEDITVFDLNFQFDSFAKAEAEGLKLEYGCLYNISLPDDSSDVVIWQNGDPSMTQLRYVLKELFRVLKPEGLLLLSGVTFAPEDFQIFGIAVGEEKFSPDTICAFTKRVS